MVVVYLDECRTAFWKVFYVSAGLAMLLGAFLFLRALVNALSAAAPLRESGAGDRALLALRGRQRRAVLGLVLSLIAAVGTWTYFILVFSGFHCAPDSLYWVGPFGE